MRITEVALYLLNIILFVVFETFGVKLHAVLNQQINKQDTESIIEAVSASLTLPPIMQAQINTLTHFTTHNF